MNDQPVFTINQLLAFGSFLVVVIGVMMGIIIKLIRLGTSVKKIKNNDLGGFLKKDDFQEFKEEYIEDITGLKKDVKYLMDKVCKK